MLGGQGGPSQRAEDEHAARREHWAGALASALPAVPRPDAPCLLANVPSRYVAHGPGAYLPCSGGTWKPGGAEQPGTGDVTGFYGRAVPGILTTLSSHSYIYIP